MAKNNFVAEVTFKNLNLDLFRSIWIFHVTDLFLYPLKTSGFLMFSGDIKRDQ